MTIRRKLYEAANINGWITAEQAAAIAEQHFALLQSPEVVEVGAMSLAAYAWEYGIADTVQEDVGIYVAENWKRYVGQFNAAIAAITSFIEGDDRRSSTVEQRSSVGTGESPAGLASKAMEPSPTSYAEPSAPDEQHDIGQIAIKYGLMNSPTQYAHRNRIESALRTISDEGKSDAGTDGNSFDFWIKLQGVEYYINAKPTTPDEGGA